MSTRPSPPLRRVSGRIVPARCWLLIGLWLATLFPARAATVSYSTGFNFNHAGSVNTGALSILTTYTNTEESTSGALSLPRFNASLGTLTGAVITTTTTTGTLTVQKTTSFNALLLSSASASSTLAYSISAGTMSASGSANATTSGATLLNLLGTPSAPIDAAVLNDPKSFSTPGDLTQLTGSTPFSINLTATNVFVVRTGVSLFNAGFTGNGTYAGTVTVVYTYTPVTSTVSGYVYRDANRNGLRDSSESGTGLTIYAKLLAESAPAGPALQAVSVNAASGAYLFPGVTTGTYRIVLSANTTLSDVTPVTVPPGWTMTENDPRILPGVAVGIVNVSNRNFGYVPFTALSGHVFRDSGTGGGTANDGIRNGGETGIGGIAVRLLDGGGAALDSTQTAADGSYRLYLPSSLATGATLRVVETNATGLYSTGGSPGTTAGTYLANIDTVTFTHTAGAAYTGVNFADVPAPQLTGDGQQSTQPGTAVSYPHRFTAGTAGQVLFTITSTQSPAIAGWTEMIYLDVNGNGQVDPADQIIAAPISVTENQVLNLVIKVFAPLTAPHGAQAQTALNASFTFTGATPPLNVTLTRTDLTTITGLTTAGLKLIKSVDKAQARPGDAITYTINFVNDSATTLHDVVVSDEIPTFTKFVSAGTGSLPSGFTLGSLNQPTVGARGTVRWIFAGSFPATASGTVSFTVIVDQ